MRKKDHDLIGVFKQSKSKLGQVRAGLYCDEISNNEIKTTLLKIFEAKVKEII